MQIIQGARGALSEAFRRLLADERGFLRLYLSPEDDGGSAPDDDEPAAPADDTPEPEGGGVEDPDKKRLHEEAKRHRLRAKEARQAAEEAKKAAEAAQAELARIKRSIDPDAGDDADADEVVKAEKARADKVQRNAERALIKAEYSREWVAKGMDPERFEKAFKLADLDSVEVDLEQGTVDGVAELVAADADEYPEWRMNKTKTPPPSVDNGAPAGANKPGIDLNKVQPGDISKLSDEEFIALMEEGVDVLHRTPTGEVQRIRFQTGGNETAQRIRRLMNGDSPLADPLGTGVRKKRSLA